MRGGEKPNARAGAQKPASAQEVLPGLKAEGRPVEKDMSDEDDLSSDKELCECWSCACTMEMIEEGSRGCPCNIASLALASH